VHPFSTKRYLELIENETTGTTIMKRTAYSSTLEENLFLNRFNPREEVFNSS
jgi:hypothetical protein